MTDVPRDQRAQQVDADVREAFTRIENAAAENASLDTLLRVYGEYEAALRQVDTYFSLLNKAPSFSTTNTSGV